MHFLPVVFATVVATMLLSTPATPGAQPQPPGFKSGVQMIEVDVRVFDAQGRFVNDLGRDDFEVRPADTLNSLAVDTGGLMIFNENNVRRSLDTVAADAGIYYVLGYQPSNTKYDGKYRTIDVRAKRRDVRVRARKGYMAIDPRRLAVPAR